MTAAARRFSALCAVALSVAALVAVPPAAESAHADSELTCSGKSTSANDGQSVARRPVIFVHGWTANGGALHDTGDKLKVRTNDRIQPYYFDYGDNSTTWASNEAVAGCLAAYVRKVSKAFTDVHGDGKVLIVAHSMGGLATLYASANRDVADVIGGVISFDTPYLGSPFGDTELGALVQGWKEFFPSTKVPPAGSNAQQCLGLHREGGLLPADCSSDLPPYLARTVPISEIAGQVTVSRSFAGTHLYDISLDSDGVVSTSSSHGYLEIRRKAAWPYGEPMTLTTDACTIKSDTLQTAATAARWTKSMLVGLAAGAGQIYADNSALDGLSSGKLTPGLTLYLGAALLAAPCSHIHVYNDRSALTQATVALKADLDFLAAANAPWTAPVLLITPTSLGAVRAGMTLPEAEAAAKLPFPGAGDGAYYPYLTSANAPHLYIRGGGTSFTSCRGTQGNGTGTPIVTTAEGIRLGDSISKLKATYGSRLSYVPMPSGGGLAPIAGYVLTEPTGTLIFGVDYQTGSKIQEIAGSPGRLQPSACPG